jgi:hypothetical protein
MDEDGYLLMRSLQDRQAVLTAGMAVMEQLRASGAADPAAEPGEMRIAAGAKGGFLGGRKNVSHDPRMLAVLESPAIMGFFDRFLAQPATTFDYKWIRAVGTDGFTGAHYDVVYMGRGSQRLYTCWTPLCDVPIERGPLAICVGSHSLPGFEKLRQTYGRMDVDRDHVHGWFSDDPAEITRRFGGCWHTAEFRAGDVLIFGMYTLHASVRNRTDRFRISTDTRFQPAADPADERWVGPAPKAHYAWHDRVVTMEEARKQWGV